MVSMSAPLLDQLISIKPHTETIGPFTFTYAMSAAWRAPWGYPCPSSPPQLPCHTLAAAIHLGVQRWKLWFHSLIHLIRIHP
ncbi:hypothetical protein AB205_0189200 [Aquarana catesbeiana]|uniref:Uncharacterized protein n=1 Tax=Aquarana catesbeiana TaxID=8400 RepID=A0A2G9RKT7_AQUCT|nr:hypothetical protein AB205_0189200 [Aquarana catesbeiana]